MTRATALRLSVLVSCAGLLGACAAGSPWYQAPAGLTGETGATVSMSTNPATPNGPDGNTRVATVDGAPLSVIDWNKVVLPAGPHTLGLEYDGATAASAAAAPVRVTLRTGGAYIARGAMADPCDAVVWLEDASGNRISSEKLVTQLIAKPVRTGAPVFAVACE